MIQFYKFLFYDMHNTLSILIKENIFSAHFQQMVHKQFNLTITTNWSDDHNDAVHKLFLP